MRTRTISVVVTVLAIAGCGGTSDVGSTGPGTYMVESHGTMGWSSGPSQKAKSFEKATGYCQKQHKGTEPIISLASGEVQFRCVDELPAPPEGLIHDPRILASPEAGTIILVRVVELEVQGLEMQELVEAEMQEYGRTFPPYATATMLVLKSWRGPFAAGEVLHTPKGRSTCNGPCCIAPTDDCRLYDFQLEDRGKEFLIMGHGGQPDPHVVFLRRKWVWPAAKSQALMGALDQAVADSMSTDKAGYAARLRKETAVLEDVETKLQAAQSNRAPDEEIAHLRNQLRGHQENARRFQIARDYLDKHPEKSGESADRLVWDSLPDTAKRTTPTMACPAGCPLEPPEH